MKTIAKPGSEAQKLVAWSNTCSEWGRGLPLANYIEREKKLESRSLTSSNITVWVLVPEEDPDSLDLLCHLDAIIRPAYFKKDSFIENVSIVTLASVFTPNIHRGQGFASQLIKKLHKQLQYKNIFGCVLYSDIGTFYERFGYFLCSPHHVTLPHNNNFHSVTALNEEDIIKLAEKDCVLVKQEMLKNTGCSLIITPHAASYDWHFERSKIYASSLGKQLPTIFGAKHEDEFLIWTYDYPNKKLTVLRHRLLKHASILLSAAQFYASQQGLSQVYIWNLEPSLIQASELENNANFVTREKESLPYICPFNTKDLQFSWDIVQYYTWA